MNKGVQFWLDSWREGHIPFHKLRVNQDLVSFWPALEVCPRSTVLVPLCGKSLDMLWLLSQGYHVIGMELSEQAVLQFFQENQLTYTVNSSCYQAEHLTIWVGDIFTFDSSCLPPIDAVYDNAALIALPHKLRALYASLCLNWLKPEGAILLKTIHCSSGNLSGPPYNVTEEEIGLIYPNCTISSLKKLTREHQIGTVVESADLEITDEYVWRINKIG